MYTLFIGARVCKDKKFVESKLIAKEAEELKERVQAELNEADPEEDEGKKVLEKATSSVVKIS